MLKERFDQSITAWDGGMLISQPRAHGGAVTDTVSRYLQRWPMRDRKDKEEFYSLPIESGIHKKFETKTKPLWDQQ